MMTDPIADMLTRIRNANSRFHKVVEIPFSKTKQRIAQVLLDEGFIAGVEEGTDKARTSLVIKLKYEGKLRAINGLKRVSKPGLRVYSKKTELPRVLGGLGIAVVSTPQGIMPGKKARELGIGGEILLSIW